ncbi:MAG TPA: hypothetical protein VFQ62_16900 [Methylomirabilota bacterium]|jgi:hypothetical protein|nr:hypothetical protein [Methylomirabilota bacterium]
MNAGSTGAIASSRLRIVRSRQRIRASRVLIHPVTGGDGSGPTVSPIDLRRRIRGMILTGQLPPLLDRRSWIGQGHGEPCLLCEQMISSAHWEHEVDVPPVGEIRVHGVCFRIWLEESEQVRKIA